MLDFREYRISSHNGGIEKGGALVSYSIELTDMRLISYALENFFDAISQSLFMTRATTQFEKKDKRTHRIIDRLQKNSFIKGALVCVMQDVKQNGNTLILNSRLKASILHFSLVWLANELEEDDMRRQIHEENKVTSETFWPAIGVLNALDDLLFKN